jgi:RNA polymerase sigma-70 factor (ECF subfamily)
MIATMQHTGGFRRTSVWQLPDRREDRADLFMRLAREQESVMIRVARRLCGTDYDFADDCVQDAIVSGFRAFTDGRLTEIEAFRSWMLRILMNRFLAESRKRRRIEFTDEIGELVEQRQDVSSDSGPLHELLEGMLSPEIAAALDALPPDQKMVVVLVDIEAMEYAEAAGALGVPIGTVRSRLARARLKLAQVIRPHLENSDEPRDR